MTGTAAPARNRRPPTAEKTRPHAVYAAYAASGDVLYVGMSWQPDVRWRQHRDKPWHGEIDRWTVLGWYPNWTQAKAMETFLIDSWQPRYNIAENPAWRAALDSYAGHAAPRRAPTHLATAARLAARILWRLITIAVALAVFLITLTANILTNRRPPRIHQRSTRHRRRRRHR